MYGRKQKSCAFLALGWYALYIISMLVFALLHIGIGTGYHVLHIGLMMLPLLLVVHFEKSFASIGFQGTNQFRDLLTALLTVTVCVLIALVAGKLSLLELCAKALYYFLYVALLEELVFRGFLQNYLMGFLEMGVPEWVCRLIGGAMFALVHVPIPVWYSFVAIEYFLMVIPQLVFAFVFHVAMCVLTEKRGNIMLPIAIHFAVDFLQNI